eukprot:s352_g24.t1
MQTIAPAIRGILGAPRGRSVVSAVSRPKYKQSIGDVALRASKEEAQERLKDAETLKMGATNDPRFTQKGRASAWLIKARSDGSNAKWFQSMGRRFFILDFDKRIFYYTYTESRQAQASTPIPFDSSKAFAAMCLVNPCGISCAIEDCGQHCHSRPRRCLPGSYPFTVRTKGKRLRLEAEEESEAFRWISMLNAAHRIGAEFLQLVVSSHLKMFRFAILVAGAMAIAEPADMKPSCSEKGKAYVTAEKIRSGPDGLYVINAISCQQRVAFPDT